jgi:hypothetical protein
MEPRERKRAIAIVLAFVSAIGFAISSFENKWLVSDIDDDLMGIGLRHAKDCYIRCDSISNTQLVEKINKAIDKIIEDNKALPANQQRAVPKRPWDGFPVVGWITFVASLVAAAGLLVGALLTIARKRPVLPIMPTTIAVLGLMISIIAGCVFVATKPAGNDVLVVGWTFVVYGVAAVVGLASVFPLNRQIRPIDVELGAASATMSWGGSRDDA